MSKPDVYLPVSLPPDSKIVKTLPPRTQNAGGHPAPTCLTYNPLLYPKETPKPPPNHSSHQPIHQKEQIDIQKDSVDPQKCGSRPGAVHILLNPASCLFKLQSDLQQAPKSLPGAQPVRPKTLPTAPKMLPRRPPKAQDVPKSRPKAPDDRQVAQPPDLVPFKIFEISTSKKLNPFSKFKISSSKNINRVLPFNF